VAEFKEVLYESMLYSFGKILATYNVFAQDTILKEIGKEVIEYLERHGYSITQTDSPEDSLALIEMFVKNGFAELTATPADKGDNFVWKNLYGVGAYSELQEITDNPFLSCPLNASLYHILSKHDKMLKLYSQSFNLKTRSAKSHEEIVESDLGKGRELFDPLVVENRRLLRISEEKNRELEKALEEIKTLRGLIPICAKCKKIRDEDGYWNQLEAYIEKHSHSKFTHGLCDDCLEELINKE